MSMRNKQQGATFFSLMIILIVAGVFLAVGFKLYPPYWDHKLIVSVMTDLTENPDTREDSATEIRSKIMKRLRINQVKLPVQKAVKIDEKEGIKTIVLKYDVTVPMFYNVDAVVKFHEQYEVISR
ncbi:DUF4845 domain-containing protein [Amphritea balenae]|uniref:DUF4845 domain-containing protein n=1 Tax=Amphritea balenae TaxID=452629 RepID=A0A3P1SMK8_9GAMM|nr:DUF4845 domain-containing protein [Amphritea balenae]RRC98386.1 DUF4845 domain-containing protein [Amphritea balenae]GGK81475.1 hypothetical protein GCM10007941_34890 [Amphritea balenae]